MKAIGPRLLRHEVVTFSLRITRKHQEELNSIRYHSITHATIFRTLTGINSEPFKR
jgi:hypothetical protein